MRQRQRLEALGLTALHPGLERAGAAGRREVRVLPVGAQQHVGRHQPPPRPHRLAERARAAVERGVRGDREPERARADDCGVDAIHVSQPSALPASFGRCAHAITASSSGLLAARAGQRDHRRRRRARRATPTTCPTTPESRRCGRTAATPGRDWYFCATAALNGAGELTGTHEIEEWGCQEVPVLLTGTPYVGAVYAGVTHVLTARQPRIGRDDVIIPVVGECDPSSWCDVRARPRARRRARGAGARRRRRRCRSPRARSAPASAWRRSASRAASGRPRASSASTRVGVLVLSNFGLTERFVLVRAAGRARARERDGLQRRGLLHLPRRHRRAAAPAPAAAARAAPVPRARRARAPTARTAPGEIAFAWTTANLLRARRAPADVRDLRMLRDDLLSVLFAACAEAAEEAVLNALCAGRDLRGYDGQVLPRFPAERFALTLTPARAGHRYARAMRIAVIGGAGGMGRVTTADAATSDGVEQVILVDRDASRAAEVAAAYGNVEVRDAGRRRRRPASPRWPAPTPSSTPPRTGSTCRVMRGLPRGRRPLHRPRRPLLLRDRAVRARRRLPARRALGRDLDGRRTGHHEHAGGRGRAPSSTRSSRSR